MATEANSGSFKKGHKINLGRKHPKEFGVKVSKRCKGKKMSKEFCEKIKLSNFLNPRHFWLGKKRGPMSSETKKKIGKANSGSNSSFWKGGITPKNKKARTSMEFKLWREAVFKRDNYTCQKYGIKGCNLHPHHILNFAQYEDLRFAIDNGITLSEKAHNEFHKIYGKKNNSREQLLEFLNSK